ncbi:MAG: GBS Bsp-like repeat-containing protein [Ruminococcus sp.]|nr:GBS Bsp-like repeat-containing protein [Ruminococcus sp.]
MKQRVISILLCLVMILSCFTSLSAVSVNAATVSVSQTKATQNQLNIVARADYMYDTTWVCQTTVAGWGGTFYAGSTYHIPYGQPINTGKYVGFENFGATREEFLEAAADPNSKHYTVRSTYNKESTYYCNDCSAFVSYAWDISRNTTSSLPYKSTNLGKATESNIRANLQLGDALNHAGSHVILVTGITYSGDTMTQIEITEQTPPQIKRSYYTPSSLASKYSSTYSILRYEGTVDAPPNVVTTVSPEANLDEVIGGASSLTVKGWAFDRDNVSKALDVHVYIGGPAGEGEGHTITANAERTDVHNAYGCGNNHGFDAIIPTSLTGQQEVYIYAIDDSGANDSTLVGNTTVNITADTENPVVSEVTVVSSDNNGYTLSCNVSDNGYLKNVLFPTWIDSPENAIWYEGTVNNGVATCTISIADFDNYNGRYYTHVYAYDLAGNSGVNGDFYTTFHEPTATLDVVEEENGKIHVRGWAFDKDAIDEPLEVHVYVGGPAGAEGVEGKVIYADKPREDVDALHGCGPNHGFDDYIDTGLKGTQDVCVYVINKGNGGTIQLETRTITISDDTVAPTIENVKIASSTLDSFTVSCDATDDRKITEISMAVWSEATENPIWYDMTLENGVATATVPLADFDDMSGKYTIHVYAYDSHGNKTGYPYETTFNNPEGCFDEVENKGGAIFVRGWAFDYDNIDEALEIHVYIGGEAGSEGAQLHKIKADTLREDIEEVYGTGLNHGFDSIITTDLRGEQTVYVYAINTGNGGNVFVGSKTVTITEPVLADVDLDGAVTIMDATLVQMHLAKLYELTGVALKNSDTNKDGVISISDATTIQMYLAGLIEEM